MPIKHVRHDTEIERFADELAGRWRQGDGVEPFLRRLEPELSRMVRSENWSWESVARSLNGARIAYQSGRPWNGATLAQKMANIRHDGRKRSSRANSSTRTGERVETRSPTPGPEPRGNSPDPASPPAISPLVDEEEPEFAPATLLNWSGKRIIDRDNAPNRQPAPTPAPARDVAAVDVDAVLARLLGKT